MKKTAKISAILLNKEDISILKLKNEYFIILIPRNLVTNSGIKGNTFDFDLISKNNSLSLGTSLTADQETTVMINDV